MCIEFETGGDAIPDIVALDNVPVVQKPDCSSVLTAASPASPLLIEHKDNNDDAEYVDIGTGKHDYFVTNSNPTGCPTEVEIL